MNMISALYRYPKHERRKVAQDWARRSNAVQNAARLAREPDADTLRHRALHDARGQVVRHGATYRAAGVTHWIVRRSITGSVRPCVFLVAGGGTVPGTELLHKSPSRAGVAYLQAPEGSQLAILIP